MVVFQGLRPDRIERIGCLDWRGWAFREVAIDGVDEKKVLGEGVGVDRNGCS